ncbi:3-ketoacyl-CoA thiolase, mitochondrial-like [Manduca sexta]|uniref:3-ketoacyl-CoA thiolase, mitochondrial-like n=1 Tax=Manduca sexta TaxID=7130 RepID=UPI00188F7D0A|nr:3-ketoacyl-CoA thiolase, mitochondrial-like [Manduca sexta]
MISRVVRVNSFSRKHVYFLSESDFGAMALSSKGVYIVGAKRTPFCSYGGQFREWQACHAFVAAAKDAMSSANVDPGSVDQTVVGNVNYLSQCDGGKTPRYCGIYSGIPIDRPALGVNKACGTGLQAIITAAVDMLIGTSNLCLVGGTEIMSSLPLLVRDVRFGTTFTTPYKLEDQMRSTPDSFTGMTMQKLAKETTKKNSIAREEIYKYNAESILRWTRAQKSGIFSKEITKVNLNINKKDVVVDEDQPARADISAEERDNIIALDNEEISDNSSSPADGAVALVLASEEAIKRHSLQPLARVAGWACTGSDPSDIAAGTVTAIQKLLGSCKLSADDVDLYEINETFAAQVLVVAKQLKLDLRKVNVNGGALAVGNPVAATGARMATHLCYELGRRNLKRGLAASQCGLGQGIAVTFERL